MERILIVGATGMLGTNLAPYLRGLNISVVTHGNSSNADWNFDLSDNKVALRRLSEINPTTIINLASLTNVDMCEADMHLAYLSNTHTVEVLVDWIRKNKPNCYLVHISTDHVYDGLASSSSEEEVCLVNNYAFSKYAGELAALQIASCILRVNFIGRSQLISRPSFSDWIWSSAINNKEITLFGDVFFSPLSISRLVNVIERVLIKKIRGIFNVGAREGMSKAEFGMLLVKAFGITNCNIRVGLLSDSSNLAKRPKNMCMNVEKIENALGIELPNLKDIAREIANEYAD